MTERNSIVVFSALDSVGKGGAQVGCGKHEHHVRNRSHDGPDPPWVTSELRAENVAHKT